MPPVPGRGMLRAARQVYEVRIAANPLRALVPLDYKTALFRKASKKPSYGGLARGPRRPCGGDPRLRGLEAEEVRRGRGDGGGLASGRCGGARRSRGGRSVLLVLHALDLEHA